MTRRTDLSRSWCQPCRVGSCSDLSQARRCRRLERSRTSRRQHTVACHRSLWSRCRCNPRGNDTRSPTGKVQLKHDVQHLRAMSKRSVTNIHCYPWNYLHTSNLLDLLQLLILIIYINFDYNSISDTYIHCLNEYSLMHLSFKYNSTSHTYIHRFQCRCPCDSGCRGRPRVSGSDRRCKDTRTDRNSRRQRCWNKTAANNSVNWYANTYTSIAKPCITIVSQTND